MELLDTIVIGAGQSGLATGYYLRKAGLRFAILEAGDSPSGSWSRYYDSLKLFSPGRYSSLPGLAFPATAGEYPTRDEVVRYLTSYAERFELPVMTGTEVLTATRRGDLFRIDAAKRTFHARTVIAATGSFRSPYVPEIDGAPAYQGRVLHSSAYLAPSELAGRRVVVVGAGNSAVQIAVELAAVARVTLATREPVRFLAQKVAGCDVHCWMHYLGLDRLPLGHFFRLREPTKVLDIGVYRKAIEGHAPEQRPMFSRFTPEGVVWQDGSAEQVDAVLFATGYRPHLPYLAPLGVGGPNTPLRHRAGVSIDAEGLYFVGLFGQRTFSSATLRGVGRDAAYVVRQLRRYLDRKQGAVTGRIPIQSDVASAGEAHERSDMRQSSRAGLSDESGCGVANGSAGACRRAAGESVRTYG